MNKSNHIEPKMKEFLVDYNELLSKASMEHNYSFASLASPTLNKQETVSFLYRDVVKYIEGNDVKITIYNLVRLHVEFVMRMGFMFFNLVKTSLQFRVNSIPEECMFIRTWLVPRSIVNDRIRDEYFRELIDDLSKEYPVVVGYQPLGFGKTLKSFNKAQKPENFIIPVGLLNLIDIIQILARYCFSAKIKLRNDYLYKGSNIKDIINISLGNDYFKLRSFQAYLEHKIAEKISKYNPKYFIYVFENQAWENAYLSQFKGSKVKIIGYQSSGFSFNFLNFMPSKLDAINAFFPDKILTVGDAFTKLLKEFGNYPIPIETFAALRFDYPSKKGKYIINDPVSKIFKRILYAFPVHFYQYPIIINDLKNSFGETDIEVHLRYHPLFQENQNKFQLPDNFKIWLKNNKKLNETYDLILFNDNSFGIESLIEGVKSYEYDIGEVYNQKRMFNFNIYDNHMNKEGLVKLKNLILADKYDKLYSKELVANFIESQYKTFNGFNEKYFL